MAVLDPHGHKDTVKPLVVQKSDELWYIEYTAVEIGLHSVNVFFAGKVVPNSPFGVGVSPGGCRDCRYHFLWLQMSFLWLQMSFSGAVMSAGLNVIACTSLSNCQV